MFIQIQLIPHSPQNHASIQFTSTHCLEFDISNVIIYIETIHSIYPIC